MLRPRLDSQGQELQTAGNSHTLRSARGCAVTPAPFQPAACFQMHLDHSGPGWGAAHREAGWRHPHPSRGDKPETAVLAEWQVAAALCEVTSQAEGSLRIPGTSSPPLEGTPNPGPSSSCRNLGTPSRGNFPLCGGRAPHLGWGSMH